MLSALPQPSCGMTVNFLHCPPSCHFYCHWAAPEKKCMVGWGVRGTLPSGQSRLQQLCFSFMKCTHPTLLEGAQCKSCQGNANPNAAFGIACFCQHLPQFPEPAGRCETRRAAVCPAQLPPASRSAGGSWAAPALSTNVRAKRHRKGTLLTGRPWN